MTIYLLVKRRYDLDTDYHDWESEVEYELGYFSDKAEAEAKVEEYNNDAIETGYASYLDMVESSNLRHRKAWETRQLQDKALEAAGLPPLVERGGRPMSEPVDQKPMSKERWIEKERVTHYELEEVKPYKG